MANLSLDITRTKAISQEIVSLDNTLKSNYFPALESVLSAIGSNVNNTEVHSLLSQISDQALTIRHNLTTNLSNLENFLETQLSSYTVTQEKAYERLAAVLTKMDSFVASRGTANATGTGYQNLSNTTGTNPQSSNGNQPTEAKYDHGWGGKYAETWTSWWGDVKEAYSDTNGFVSAIGNTAEAALDTAGAIVETAANAISDVAHSVGNVISWIFR